MNVYGVRFSREFAISNEVREFGSIFPIQYTIEHIRLIGSSNCFYFSSDNM